MTAAENKGVLMTETTLRPPFDPELEAALALVADTLPWTLTAEMIRLPVSYTHLTLPTKA